MPTSDWGASATVSSSVSGILQTSDSTTGLHFLKGLGGEHYILSRSRHGLFLLSVGLRFRAVDMAEPPVKVSAQDLLAVLGGIRVIAQEAFDRSELLFVFAQNEQFVT